MYPLAISTINLTRDFKTIRAIDRLSLDVPAGIVCGFLGPNGAGKTTTISLLLGILEPTRGEARVLGFDTRSESGEIRMRTGALLEHHGLYERLTVEENLDFYGRVWHIPAKERSARIHELLTHVDLWDRRNERVVTLSHGMKQKLAVSRAIFHHPSLLFLDEPTAGLDPMAATALRNDISDLVKKEGMTVFLTTHNLSEAEKLCSLVGVISKGKLLTVGHPDELRASAGKARVEVFGRGFTETAVAKIQAHPGVQAVETQNPEETHGRMSLHITLAEDMTAAPLVRLMVEEGIEIEEVRRGAASLEEAFLKLMENEQ